MKINKTEFQKALEIVKPGLANQELIEQSTSFAFFGNRVVTYNDSISLSHPIEGLELEGAVRAEELYKFLNRSKKEEIQLSIGDAELKLKCGRAIVGLTLQSEIVLPLSEVNDQKDWEDLPNEGQDFCEDLKFVKDSCSKDMSRRILTCAHASPTIVEASDGFQIMRVNTPEEIGFPFDALIPAENITEITKIEPNQVAETEGWLHFRNGTGTELSCRVLNDTYPETSGHMEVEGAKVIFPSSMSEILDRVRVFTEDGMHMDEEMEVKLAKGKLMVHGKNEYGYIKEKAKVKYSGEPASFWITPYLLQNILKRSNQCTLGSEKIKFSGDDWEYIATLRG